MVEPSEQIERKALLSLSQSSLDTDDDDKYATDDSERTQRQTSYNLYQLPNPIEHSKTEEENPPKQEEYETYISRWYILVLFSVISAQQSVVWNTWGPIADTTKAVLGWTNADIALLTNWGPITYVVSAPLFSWVLDVKGLRVSMLLSSLLLMLGVAIRCIPVPIKYMIWIMNIGQIFIGLSNPILTAAPPLVSAVWFPPHQRTTSTCILSNNLGVAISFLMGPLIVKDLKYQNSTSIVLMNETTHNNFSDGYGEHIIIPPNVRNQRLNEINLLLYVEAGITAILFIFTVIYFPAKPPTPPSSSAETKRQDFVEGAKLLFINCQFWLPALCFGISIGVWNVWSSLIDIIFSTVNQLTIGWIGFYSQIVGVVVSLPVAIFIDRLAGKMKLILLLLSSVGTAGVIWIILMVLKVMPLNLASLYVTLIGISIVINSVYAPYLELTVEGTYPVAEGITAMIMTWLMNFFGLVFLLIMMDAYIGVLWMNYAMLGAFGVCIPMLLLYKERYNRLSQDTVAI